VRKPDRCPCPTIPKALGALMISHGFGSIRDRRVRMGLDGGPFSCPTCPIWQYVALCLACHTEPTPQATAASCTWKRRDPMNLPVVCRHQPERPIRPSLLGVGCLPGSLPLAAPRRSTQGVVGSLGLRRCARASVLSNVWA